MPYLVARRGESTTANWTLLGFSESVAVTLYCMHRHFSLGPFQLFSQQGKESAFLSVNMLNSRTTVKLLWYSEMAH